MEEQTKTTTPNDQDIINQVKQPQEDNKEVTQDEALENSKNPERTGQYIDKLNEEKKKAQEEARRYKNVLESLIPQEPVPQQVAQQYSQPINRAPSADQFKNLNQSDIDNEVKSMVDENGYLDGNKLISVLKQLDERANRAEEMAAKTKREQEENRKRQLLEEQQRQRTQKMEQVHKKYPQLDPENEEFNPRYFELVRNELLGQLVNGKEDPMAAADKWAKLYVSEEERKEDEMAKTKQEKEIDEKKQEQKDQIRTTATRSTSSVGFYEKQDEEQLREKIRKGQKGALAEKLRRIGQ